MSCAAQSTGASRSYASKLALLALILLFPVSLIAQPIAYLLPDIGTPGMNTYVEIVGMNNAFGGFGVDSIYANNPGDGVRVVCVNPADTNFVKFGPCVVSWNGRMISTQAFVMPWVQVNSSDWQTGDKIPIRVQIGNVWSSIDYFYIVKPQTVGVLNIPGLLGSGGKYGKRSRRGAMIVDSITLNGVGTYGISTIDCDPLTPGNQGYLPPVLISLGPVRMAATAKLDVSGVGVDAGPGGGGGGNGLTCGTRGGNGFTSGGGDGTWTSGCGDRPAGAGTGMNQNALNNTPGGQSSAKNEGGGGGAGHAFGSGGAAGGAGTLGGGNPGYGGGTGGPQGDAPPKQGGGGGGGFATAGGNGGFWQGYLSGGYQNGNQELVPLAGGSGGGGGNVNGASGTSGAGSGGGAGGCLAIDGMTLSISNIMSQGGLGTNDTGSDDNGAGGGGSGGAITLGGKISIGHPFADVRGGGGGLGTPKMSGQDGGVGGSGRVRFDGLITTSSSVTPTDATQYIGPSTDTSHDVLRTFTLTGTGNSKDIRVYVKPMSDNWSLVAVITGYVKSWNKQITLPGTDTMYLLAAAQLVPAPDTDTFIREPSWVFSQVAANILHVVGCAPLSATITPSGPIEFCAGENRTIVASPAGLKYAWSKNGVPLATTSNSLVVTDSGIYHVLVSTPEGCSDSASVKVIVDTQPTVALSITDTIKLCAGESRTIHAASTPTSASVKWTLDGVDLHTSADSLMISNTGHYGVFVSSTGGCMDSAFVQAVVNPLPVASISPADSIMLNCANPSVMLTASGGTTYLWNNGVTSSEIAVTDTGSYFVTVTDANGCSAVSKRVVAWWQKPSVSLSSEGDTTICADSGVRYVRHIQITNQLAASQKVVTHRGASIGFIGIPDTIVLAPNETRTIADTLFTNGSAIDYQDSFYFSDPCGVGFDYSRFKIHALAIPPQIALELLPAGGLSANIDDNVSLQLRLAKRVASCLTKIHFSLTHDGDLLSYRSSSNTNFDSTSSDGSIDYYTLDVNGDTGIVAALNYKVFLARADSTPITLSIISADDTCSSTARCTQSTASSSSSVRYVLGCTEGFEQALMRNGEFFIDRISPNPAQTEIEIRVSGEAGTLQATLYDALGRAFSHSTPVKSEGGVYSLDVSEAPPGIYYLRLASGGFAAIREVSIVR